MCDLFYTSGLYIQAYPHSYMFVRAVDQLFFREKNGLCLDRELLLLLLFSVYPASIAGKLLPFAFLWLHNPSAPDAMPMRFHLVIIDRQYVERQMEAVFHRGRKSV